MRLKTAKCLTKCHNQKTFKNHMKNAMFLASWLGNITPRWSKDEVTFWVNITEGYKARTARWREAQINPTPIRSR
jgi:hypothetical protein